MSRKEKKEMAIIIAVLIGLVMVIVFTVPSFKQYVAWKWEQEERVQPPPPEPPAPRVEREVVPEEFPPPGWHPPDTTGP